MVNNNTELSFVAILMITLISFAVGYGVSYLVNSEHKEFYTETIYQRIAWNAVIDGRVTDILCTRGAYISRYDDYVFVSAVPVPDPNYQLGDVSPYAYYTECVYTIEKEVIK